VRVRDVSNGCKETVGVLILRKWKNLTKESREGRVAKGRKLKARLHNEDRHFTGEEGLEDRPQRNQGWNGRGTSPLNKGRSER